MIENKQVMAKNILHYMEINGVNATDICKALGFKHNTFSDWVNAKAYPRIDKIELMARYFHISKADLVEEHKPDDLSKLIPEDVMNDPEQYDSLKTFISAYLSIDSNDRVNLANLVKSLQPKTSPPRQD